MWSRRASMTAWLQIDSYDVYFVDSCNRTLGNVRATAAAATDLTEWTWEGQSSASHQHRPEALTSVAIKDATDQILCPEHSRGDQVVRFFQVFPLLHVLMTVAWDLLQASEGCKKCPTSAVGSWCSVQACPFTYFYIFTSSSGILRIAGKKMQVIAGWKVEGLFGGPWGCDETVYNISLVDLRMTEEVKGLAVLPANWTMDPYLSHRQMPCISLYSEFTAGAESVKFQIRPWNTRFDRVIAIILYDIYILVVGEQRHSLRWANFVARS